LTFYFCYVVFVVCWKSFVLFCLFCLAPTTYRALHAGLKRTFMPVETAEAVVTTRDNRQAWNFLISVFVSFTALSDVPLHFPNKRIQNEAPSLNAGVKETNTAMRKFQEIRAVYKI
jgi:hypothetical protein